MKKQVVSTIVQLVEEYEKAYFEGFGLMQVINTGTTGISHDGNQPKQITFKSSKRKKYSVIVEFIV